MYDFIMSLPLHDALVCADDWRLDVDGVVPHPPQLHGLLQSSDHKQSIVSLCVDGITHSSVLLLLNKKLENTKKKWGKNKKKITSIGIGELSAAEEAQVTRPGPNCLSVSKTKSGVEVIRLKELLTVTAVVSTAVMSAVDPDLQDDIRTLQTDKLEINKSFPFML